MIDTISTKGSTMHNKMGSTIYSRVCDNLRDSIISGELGPGQRLKMSDLVKQFGTSPIPIREALQTLQGECLVTIEPHRGAKVRQVDKNFVIMVHELRTAIECMLGRKACNHLPKSALSRLEKIQAAHDDAARKNNPTKMVSTNLEFHELLYTYAGNPIAMKVLKTHSGLIRGLRSSRGYSPGRPQQVSLEHWQIIKALQTGNPDQVEQALREHCDNAAEDFIALFKTS